MWQKSAADEKDERGLTISFSWADPDFTTNSDPETHDSILRCADPDCSEPIGLLAYTRRTFKAQINLKGVTTYREVVLSYCDRCSRRLRAIQNL